ncbi:MAG TPA: hemolysin III family protein, partial [Tepidisphaeraceae bacterium]|nr:hemolysin III family protein [Tepidisphaeraceae bacterium]
MKEPFNAFSHFAGTLLSIAGLVMLLVLSDGRAWQTVAVAIYGASLVLLFTASTLLHALHSSPMLESRLERFDYACIFLLIAGTYTPLCLITLRGSWGWSLLGVEWALAMGGVLSCVSGKVGRHRLRTVIYLIMGWLAMIAIVPLMQMLSSTG